MNRKKSIKIKLLLSLVVLLITGCADKNSQTPMKDYPELSQEILSYLKKAYHEEFEIKQIRKIEQTDVTVAYCNPKSDKEFVFTVKTGGYKYGDAFYAEYGSEKVFREINEYYKPVINKLFPYKKAFFTNGGTYTDWGRIPNIEEMLDDSKNTYVMPHIYIFEDVMEKDKERFLTGVLELIRYLKKHFYFYKKRKKKVYFIYSKDYNKIETIKDIENRVWQD